MCQDPKFGTRERHAPHGHVGCGPQFMHGFPMFGRKMMHLMKHFCHCGSNVSYNTEDLGDTYLITVLLPGRAKKDVKVSLINNYLNVTAPKPKTTEKAEKQEEKEEECCGTFMKKSFIFIDVNMDIPLPHDADGESIKSVMSNGILKIKIGKKPPKDININDENN